MSDGVLKMYMDVEIRERLEQARHGYELRRTRRLCDLLGALRRLQAELEIGERPSAAHGSKLATRRG